MPKVVDLMRPTPVPVGEASSLSVSPETELDIVVERMAELDEGSALVTDEEGRTLGVLTMSDALRAFARELRKHHTHG